MRIAFRLALLDAVPAGQPPARRRAALEAAHARLWVLLERDPSPAGLPDLVQGIRDRAVLAAALEGGYEDALALVGGPS